MKMLMFDFRDSEKDFFDKNEFPDFDITFIKEPLNEMSDLTQEQYDEIMSRGIDFRQKEVIDIIIQYIPKNLEKHIMRQLNIYHFQKIKMN